MAQQKPWERYSNQSGTRPILPPDPVQQQQSQADVTKTQQEIQRLRAQVEQERAQAEFARQNAAAMAAKAQAEAAAAGQDIVESQEKIKRRADAAQRREVRGAFQTDNVLAAIRQARKVAQNEGGTGYSALLSELPASTARKLQGEIDTIISNLTFDKLQSIREDSPTGGAVGQVSDRDMKLLGSTVAALDPMDDLDTFLERLDRIERQFINMQT